MVLRINKGETMIYLASPYSDANNMHVPKLRFEQVCYAASCLAAKGYKIFSPIAHCHPIANYGLPTGFDYWEPYDREFLEFCESMIVLKLPGWRESKGVQGEIKIMEELGKKIHYLDWEDIENASLH